MTKNKYVLNWIDEMAAMTGLWYAAPCIFINAAIRGSTVRREQNGDKYLITSCDYLITEVIM